ncbi:BMP family ABC transporter substrate-binding protein [Aneurinibacillus uraniidurans]|uniref:BMP family ABC transporter substrate-binding protein n=1 Tax=Aneurinibacillus uraniidurans TaxID=2966586 RepID=UPI00234BD8EA|nr:BMP family ABC transporter substrate-binding protein [Aneurinibacillus sp. B1]WCN36936.1 BMP family ABC transporter substrate-binding protein [Aneurinibacillus sp. B1]
MKKIAIIGLFLLLIGCIPHWQSIAKQPISPTAPLKVGLLLDGKIYDQGWDGQAYRGLKAIERTYQVQTECVQDANQPDVQLREAKRLADAGYDLIFGNGRSFETVFNKLAVSYPKTRFVFFNGNAKGENVSSINFTPESMGYFSGMIAGMMTKSHKVGLIPAYDSMREVKPFMAAVKEQNPNNEVLLQDVKGWSDGKKAEEIAQKMIREGADVLAPMGDGFNIDVIMQAHYEGRLAVGYISDQYFVSKNTVITSIVQNLSAMYVKIFEQYQDGTLKSGGVEFDFADGAQQLGTFNPAVPDEVRRKIERRLEEYKRGEFVINKQTGQPMSNPKK